MARKAKKAEKKNKLPAVGSMVEHDPAQVSVEETQNAVAEYDSDSENMSEAEIAAMESRAKQRKNEIREKIEASVDTQDWTLADPVIPEELAGKVWIAVYRCPEGHKTKATNRQADSGVICWKHRELGQKVVAQIMPQFLGKPIPPTDDVEKRKKAGKGAN